MGEHKDQHYVQAAHLKSWSDNDGNVYVCDLLNGKIHQGPPSSQAFEKYYYCINDQKTGEKIYYIENSLFSDVEKALSSIKKLASSQNITQEERNNIAIYIAFQKTRVPFFESMCNILREQIDKKNILDVLENQVKFDDFISSYKAEQQDASPTPTREELLKDFNNGDFLFKYSREMSLQLMLQISEPLANLYTQSEWTILNAPQNRSFIISDNPATTISFEREDGTREVTETIFPLSPNSCLLIKQEKRKSLNETKENINGVREINKRFVLHAKRYIYSHSKELLMWTYKEYLKYQHLHKSINNNSIISDKVTKLFIVRT